MVIITQNIFYINIIIHAGTTIVDDTFLIRNKTVFHGYNLTLLFQKNTIQNIEAREFFINFYVKMEIPKGKRNLSLKCLFNKLFSDLEFFKIIF